MSKPVLLVINADNCSHCTILLADRLAINAAVKEICPSLRCLWVCIDHMLSGVLPPTLSLPYVPLVIYFPEGAWDSCIQTGNFNNGFVMSVDDMNKYTGSLSSKIPTWLHDKIKETTPQATRESSRLDSTFKPITSLGGSTFKPITSLGGSTFKPSDFNVRPVTPKAGLDTTFWFMYKGVKFTVKYSLENGIILGIQCPQMGFDTNFDIGKLLKGC